MKDIVFDFDPEVFAKQLGPNMWPYGVHDYLERKKILAYWAFIVVRVLENGMYCPYCGENGDLYEDEKKAIEHFSECSGAISYARCNFRDALSYNISYGEDPYEAVKKGNTCYFDVKAPEWFAAKKKLIPLYKENGITTCEGYLINPSCMRDFALSFHHLDKRSSGRARNTFKATRLLCAECHAKADQRPGFEEFNERLRNIR